MSKKKKLVLFTITGISLLALGFSIFLLGIRGEFREYLSEKYPGMPFAVGLTKIDPIYGKFYAEATCLDDYVSFSITKSFNTERISENYSQAKNTIQYNSRIQGILETSGVKESIKHVTGGGKVPFGDGDVYEQINIHLSDNAEAAPVAKRVLSILNENNIFAEKIILTYEREKHVFELWISSNDVGLNENEIQEKVRMIK